MSLDNLYRSDRSLPLNRKERYYTGTVLPGMIWPDGLKRFLCAIGEPDTVVNLDPDSTNAQFFTEYDLRDAIAHDRTTRHQSTPPVSETPDLVLYVQGTNGMLGLLIVFEAKMFSRPVPNELLDQVQSQKKVISYLKGRLEPFKAVQVVLLPEKLADDIMRHAIAAVPGLCLLTWECLAAAYADVPGARYWAGILKEASRRYYDLRSERFSKKYDKIKGLKICQDLRAGTFEYGYIGRSGGFEKLINEDIPNNKWQGREYFVAKSDECPRLNYFPAWKFLAALESSINQPTLR